MSYSVSLESSIALYQQGRYQEAYDLITGEVGSHDAIPALVHYLRFSFASRAGKPDLAMEIVREAVIERGYWYSSDDLSDDDLEPLRDLPEFVRIVKLCAEREEDSRHNPISEVVLTVPPTSVDGKAPALVVAMHGNQMNIHTTRLNWCGVSLSDCLVAFPQSSHAVCTGAYSWPDPEAGSKEAGKHLEDIVQSNFVDRDRVILGGFSAGGRVAMHMLLKAGVKAKGLILLGPWLPDLEGLAPLIPVLKDSGTRVYLICGDGDTDCYDSTNRLADLLKMGGVPFLYSVVKGIGHQYPADFDEELGKARAFIMDD